MMHHIPQQPQPPENRHDSAERPGRDDSWTALAEERRRQGFPTWRQTEEPERWRR